MPGHLLQAVAAVSAQLGAGVVLGRYPHGVDAGQLDPDLAGAVALAQLLAELAETEPAHPLLLAVRLALEVADARRAEHRALRHAALEVHGGGRGVWARLADNHVPHAEVARRRAEPGPLAAERRPA